LGVQRPLAYAEKRRNGAILAPATLPYPETGLDGWRHSADRTGLYGNFVLTGNFTGNFSHFAEIGSIKGPKAPVFTAAWKQIP